MKLLLPLPPAVATRGTKTSCRSGLSNARQCAAPCSSVLYMVMDTSSMMTVGEFLMLRRSFYKLDFVVVVFSSLVLLDPCSDGFKFVQNE